MYVNFTSRNLNTERHVKYAHLPQFFFFFLISHTKRHVEFISKFKL